MSRCEQSWRANAGNGVSPGDCRQSRLGSPCQHAASGVNWVPCDARAPVPVPTTLQGVDRKSTVLSSTPGADRVRIFQQHTRVVLTLLGALAGASALALDLRSEAGDSAGALVATTRSLAANDAEV